MGTLQRCAETAVRRDLERARVVLTDQRLSVDRRCAMAGHLMWVATLVDPAVPYVGPLGERVHGTAAAFSVAGDRQHREDLLCAVIDFLRVSRTVGGWTSADPRTFADHLPWLLDGLALPQGLGLQFPDLVDPLVARERARCYRRQRVLLWGTISLQVRAPRVLV